MSSTRSWSIISTLPFTEARAKRSIEGPQICTRAQQLDPKVIRGADFVAIEMSFRYRTAAPGRKTGSTWRQTLVFPANERYFVSCDRIDAVNASDAMFLRIDMPGHIRHQQGDTFSRIYLSYAEQTNTPGQFQDHILAASAFFEDFAPDARFNYQRGARQNAAGAFHSRLPIARSGDRQRRSLARGHDAGPRRRL